MTNNLLGSTFVQITRLVHCKWWDGNDNVDVDDFPELIGNFMDYVETHLQCEQILLKLHEKDREPV